MVFPTAVMRFMGDAPLKGQSELDVLCTLLKVSPADSQMLSSLPCGSLSPLPHRVAGLWGGQSLAWPKEECIPLVGGGWGQAIRPVAKCPLCPYVPGLWRVTWPALLQLCGDHEVMRDECYCQVVKQITDNTSTKQ